MRASGLIRAALAAALVLVPAGAAQAAPPEGCTGFPEIPEAYVCIEQFTPANAVPTVTQGPGQTVLVPAFCAFSQCVGPTPVTVPGLSISQGGGSVAVVHYRGQTYTVPGAVVPAFTISGVLHQECVGCGTTANNGFEGFFTGTLDGHAYSKASMAGTLLVTESNFDCRTVSAYGSYEGSVEGTVSISDGAQGISLRLSWSYTANVVVVSIAGDSIRGAAPGTRIVTSPMTDPCFGPADVSIDAAGVFTNVG